MDKNTKHIVASNLTTAYITGKSQTSISTVHRKNIPVEFSIKETFKIYQDFLDLLQEQEQKD